MRWLRSWGVVLVFVLADVLVLGLSWRQMHATPSADAAEPSGGATSSASTSTGTQDQIRGPLFLAASDRGAVLRVTRGSCDSRDPVTARVWTAATTGAALDTSRVTGLQEALGVFVTDAAMRIVGADSSCTVHGWTSLDAGATWKRGAVPSRMWYLDTDSTKSAVHGPVVGGVENLDCVPTSATTLAGGASALVTCAGANVLAVGSDATTAPVSYVVTSPAAVAQPATGLPLVLDESDSCPARLARITSQQEAQAVACLSRTAAPLGLAVNGDRVLAQVGQRLLLSNDLGRSFGTYPAGAG